MTHYPIPDAALDDRLGFVGTAGSGKTYNASGCVERLLDKHARVVVVDPLDVWWGLRLIADGTSPSRYTMPIFGGAHGDLPLNEHAGALIGETIAGMAESCVVSLGGLSTKSAERRFMLAFLDAIYRKASGEPVHIIFDEADLWAPQKSSEPMLQSRMEEICRRGRVKGLIPWLITQRPAVISKDVLSQVDGLVAFKLTSSQDRDALEGWIEGQADRQQWKEIRTALPTLQQGQGVVWIPGRGVLDTVAFPVKRTFDSSRTPKRGEKKRTAALKPLDLTALKGKLASVEAERKADDPKALRAEIARLQKELKIIPQNIPAADPAALREAENRGFAAGFDVAMRAAHHEIGALERSWEAARDVITALGKAVGACSALPLKSGPPRAGGLPTRKPLPRVAGGTGAHPADDLSGPLHRILDAIRWWNVLGVETLSHPQVGFIAGYSHKSGTWANYLSQLRVKGLIEGRGDLVLTSDGAALAREPNIPPSGDELRSTVLSKIDGPLTRILSPILAAYPDGLSHTDAAKHAGYSHQSGTWANYVSRLRVLELIDRRGDLKAQGWLFP